MRAAGPRAFIFIRASGEASVRQQRGSLVAENTPADLIAFNIRECFQEIQSTEAEPCLSD